MRLTTDLELMEVLAEAAHDAWRNLAEAQGRTDHPAMVPYADLDDSVKEYDRATAMSVIRVLADRGLLATNAPDKVRVIIDVPAEYAPAIHKVGSVGFRYAIALLAAKAGNVPIEGYLGMAKRMAELAGVNPSTIQVEIHSGGE